MLKKDPGGTSDRFFGEMRDSVNTLVITIHSKGSHGPELTKKRLRERFWVTENGGENGAPTKIFKKLCLGVIWVNFGSQFGSILGQKRKTKKQTEKQVQKKRAKSHKKRHDALQRMGRRQRHGP